VLKENVLSRQCTFSPPEETCIQERVDATLAPGALGTVGNGALTVGAGVTEISSSVQKSGRTAVLNLLFSNAAPLVPSAPVFNIADTTLRPTTPSNIVVMYISLITGVVAIGNGSILTNGDVTSPGVALPVGIWVVTVTYFTV
jgi:hypothetical protein